MQKTETGGSPDQARAGDCPVADVPKFGALLDPEEDSRYHTGDFGEEMLLCTNPGGRRAKHVNILHVGTDMDGTRPEIDRIISFMKERGFSVRHKSRLDLEDRVAVHMVILGSEACRFEDARSIIWRISMGFLGVVPYWDILWYGTDYIPQPVMPAGVKPRCSNRRFSFDGIMLADAHIRRRDDVAAWDGLFIVALKEIESHMDRIMGGHDKRRVHEKTRRFKEKVKSDKRWGPDAQLFFAAAKIIRRTRNIGAHSLANLPADEIKEGTDEGNKCIAEFDKLARKYNPPIRPPMFHPPITPACAIVHLKWLIRLTQMAITWISRYPVA